MVEARTAHPYQYLWLLDASDDIATVLINPILIHTVRLLAAATPTTNSVAYRVRYRLLLSRFKQTIRLDKLRTIRYTL